MMGAKISELAATFFYVGRVSRMPGTMGSLCGAVVALALMHYHMLNAIVLLLITVVGFWASGVHARKIRDKDPSEVVIDEVVGQMLTIYIVVTYCEHHAITFHNKTLMFLSITLFRFFDIFKPYPISFIDKKIDGGSGIMLDDIVAGVFAAGCIILGLLTFDRGLLNFSLPFVH